MAKKRRSMPPAVALAACPLCAVRAEVGTRELDGADRLHHSALGLRGVPQLLIQLRALPHVHSAGTCRTLLEAGSKLAEEAKGKDVLVRACMHACVHRPNVKVH